MTLKIMVYILNLGLNSGLNSWHFALSEWSSFIVFLKKLF
jgi:hypothetical protein